MKTTPRRGQLQDKNNKRHHPSIRTIRGEEDEDQDNKKRKKTESIMTACG